jgi:hypothetical protein
MHVLVSLHLKKADVLMSRSFKVVVSKFLLWEIA